MPAIRFLLAMLAVFFLYPHRAVGQAAVTPPSSASGQTVRTSMGPTTDANRRRGQAVRVTDAPRVDGTLDDACWARAPVMSDFITNSPSFGQPSREKTEVRVVYTDEAIYIGAYLHQRDPAKMRTDLSKRDAGGTADQFHVGFDTYRDRQNAFRFEVTAAGVQRDLRMSANSVDVSWDAVWDAEVRLGMSGWVAEMRIPFSALRFAATAEQTWGLQFARQIQYANEFSTWSPVDPNGGGSMPQWGDLEGLRQLDPPLRLAFSPYVAASVQRSPLGDTKPVEYANTRSVSGGMDVKWGINESFTLDATLVPNFGEALSDNTIRNLSPFEVQYEERRQFFTEGTELFNKAGIFYSRRIGGTPARFFAVSDSLRADEAVIRNPAQAPLLNATKISGRTRSKLGIGLLNAVAGPARALVRHGETGVERYVATSELTNYNVLVLDQVLPHNSAVTLTNTNVLRDGRARDANVTALGWNLREKSNTYEFGGQGKLSQVWPAGKKMTGTSYELYLRKVSGNWGWTVSHSATEDQYDPRDLGFLGRSNVMSQFASVNYSDYQPTGNRLYHYFEGAVTNTLLHRPRQWEAIDMFLYGETMRKNQLLWSAVVESRPFWYYDYYEPRVWGHKFRRAPYVFVSPRLSTDTRKKLFASFSLSFGESPIPNDPYLGLSASPTWVASDHLRLSGNFRLSKDHSNFGAVDWSDPDNIVFGRRNITTFDNSISTEYLVNPRMNVAVRARHYWAKLYYRQYLDLGDDGSLSPSDWSGAADENFNIFNIDFVYTWQFAPGSFLNVIWKDAVFVGDGRREDRFFDNLEKTLRAPQDNTVTVKLIYWLDAGRWL